MNNVDMVKILTYDHNVDRCLKTILKYDNTAYHRYNNVHAHIHTV